MNEKIKKDKIIGVACSELDYAFFQKIAKQQNKTLSQMIRETIIKNNKGYYDYLEKCIDNEEILSNESNSNNLFKTHNHVSKITFTADEYDKITMKSLRLGISEIEYIRRCCKYFSDKFYFDKLYACLDNLNCEKSKIVELKSLLDTIVENQNEILKFL